MKINLSTMVLSLSLFPIGESYLTAQQPSGNPAERWENAIQKFETEDTKQMPELGQTLFVGSSSIRLWNTGRSFPGTTIINRGFGGSQISDVNYFFDRIVAKYRPSVIVLYAGDNDIANGKTAESVVSDFMVFWTKIKQIIPDCTVIYIPIKPSLSRWKMWPEMEATNQEIRRFAKRQYNLRVAGIVKPMLGSNGEPKPDLFVQDGLHLNQQGYQVWTQVVEKLLKETSEGMVVDAPDITRHGETGNVWANVLVTDAQRNGPWRLEYRFGEQRWRSMKNDEGDRRWKFHYPGELPYGEHQLQIRLSPTAGSPQTITRSVKVIEE